ncbi:Endoplasmic reticulum zinc transporter [Mortierella sp. AD031]|nr:Endoplasmic reticulum zinc transporter [Mortierella sp. AD031]
MDANPQLIRRTNSPFVAASAAAASSTLAVETHTHTHGHQHHNHGHGHGHTHNSLAPSLGARTIGIENNLVQLKKPLTDTHASGFSTSSASTSTTTTPMNGNIPFSSSAAHGHSHDLFDQHQHHDHSHSHTHGHGHDHSHDHSHSHNHNHNHDHNHDHHGPQTNGYTGAAGAEHKHDHHYQAQVFQQQQQHQHDHFGHDHDHSHGPGHGHGHGHGHSHNHNHGHAHDHHAHGHHGHDHGHDHGHHHGHAHAHGHGHGHHDHGHDHHDHHQYPVSYRSQLPSYGEIFGGLMPKQKTMFTWILVHSTIAVLTWLSGMRAGSLSIIGLSYMLLFDAFGVLNIFVSSVIHTDIKMKKSTVKHPFGVQRFEILFGLFNAIFLLFIGMNMLKESLEHLMLEDDHHGGGDHGAVVRVPIFWTLVALGATLVSSLAYQNHKQFCLLLNANSQAAFSRSDSSKLVSLTSNKFTLTSLACVAGVLLVAMFPKLDALDKLIAIGQSIVMFSLGGPLAKVLGMLLLQTTPPGALETIEDSVRQVSATNPAVLRMERAHVWTNTFGQLIGTVVVSVAKGADEQAILASLHQRLQGFLDLDPQSEGTGELTVQLVQN